MVAVLTSGIEHAERQVALGGVEVLHPHMYGGVKDLAGARRGAEHDGTGDGIAAGVSGRDMCTDCFCVVYAGSDGVKE